MKGFTAGVDGPLVPWFKKVREAVSQVQPGTPRAGVLEALGPPDAIRHNVQGAGGQLQELMESVAGGETLIRYGDKEPFPEVLLYRDPYRPRRWYAFGVREGVVDAAWQDSVSGRRGDALPPPGMGVSTFLEIVLKSGDFAHSGRDKIEDPLAEALEAAGLGEVTGGGAGLGSSNIDVEVSDLARGLELIRRVLQDLGVARSTVIRQYQPAQRTYAVYEE